MDNKKKKLKILLISLSCLILAGVLALAGANALVVLSTRGQVLTAEQAADWDADCILVLGAGVWADGEPSPMLEDRLKRGLELRAAGASDTLLMSGDHGDESYDEVNVMKNYALDAGVASERVFMDHAGFSTYESMYRARAVFRAQRVIIVTQSYHLYRALYIAKAMGLDAVGVASDLRYYPNQTYRDAREVLARAKDVLFCLIKPRPTYLGEAIPVFGNGNATNG